MESEADGRDISSPLVTMSVIKSQDDAGAECGDAGGVRFSLLLRGNYKVVSSFWH